MPRPKNWESVPRGNGTKMAGGGIPRKLDVVLSMLRINRITEHDVPNLSLSVEAGATLTAVQKQLAGTGKGSFLPLDPPYTEKATIGGIIATNGSGPRRYLYNTARDLLLGIKAVLPNGDIVAFGGRTVKNVSGYDMTKLMVGSWGALGVITEITTKLLPLRRGVGDAPGILRRPGKGRRPDAKGPPFGPPPLGDGADGRKGREPAR